LRQEPEVETLLPIEIPEAEPGRTAADYVDERGPEEVLDALLPRFVETLVYHAVLENQASEHSARMIAMQNATNAAGDLIESLTLTANKIRQAAITTELMEIVGGAEALRKEYRRTWQKSRSARSPSQEHRSPPRRARRRGPPARSAR